MDKNVFNFWRRWTTSIREVSRTMGKSSDPAAKNLIRTLFKQNFIVSLAASYAAADVIRPLVGATELVALATNLGDPR